MYNLSVNMHSNPMSAASLLSVAVASGGEAIPRTPEIVNTLISMTNPFDGFNSDKSRDRTDSNSSAEPSPPSIQHTCSQLIKEGLKLTLQTKRKVNGNSQENRKRSKRDYRSSDDIEGEDSSSTNNSNISGLTPEDEERRRRRRERNKIAATKCRLKKRRKTVILVQESETLESQNHELKSQIEQLETQRRKLIQLLNVHGPTCVKLSSPVTRETSYQEPYPQQLTISPAYQENFTPNVRAQNLDVSEPQYCTVKVEGFEQSHQNYFKQSSSYVTTSVGDATYTSV